MLRSAAMPLRWPAKQSIALRVCSQQAWTPRSRITLRRGFADRKLPDNNTKPSIKDSNTVVLPGTSSTTATRPQPPPPGPILSPSPVVPASPLAKVSKDSIPLDSIPRVPPPPTEDPSRSIASHARPSSAVQAPLPTITSDSGPSAKKKPRRFRRFLITLILLSGAGYAGGVYYSLISDNFHDFFTEYVPWGEDAVLYFEERNYRKRFPRLTNPTNRPIANTGNTVTIPSKSGVSWKITDASSPTGEPPAKPAEDKKPITVKAMSQKEPADTAPQAPSQATGSEMTKAVKVAKTDANRTSETQKPTGKEIPGPPKTTLPKENSTIVDKKPATSSVRVGETTVKTSAKSPEVNEPSRAMSIEPIDPLKIQNAEEPLVQDLVKIINDVITVVNNDGSSNKYTSTMRKAKEALSNVGARIMSLKAEEQHTSEMKLRATEAEFDKAAKDLVARIERDTAAQHDQWREELATERTRIEELYQDRLSAEITRAREAVESQSHNALLQQAITLKKQFKDEVTDRVETEREGRLSKLENLSSSVSELERLTADWNAVIDANLQTQHLQVAVEAVRHSLESADRPRPFVRELAALKELAPKDDSLVSAAIASINPSAYQRGVPTSAQLIDRFRRVASEVRKASLLPEEAGVASHAASFVLSKFLFKKNGLTTGDDVESVLTRTETLLEEGRLDEAAREMNSLEGWAKTLSWDWMCEARRVLEVRQAVDVIATEARLEGLRADS